MDVFENSGSINWLDSLTTIATFEFDKSEMLKGKEFTCLIVDDELLARKRIKKLLLDQSNIKLLDECSNGELAIMRIEELSPDFIFLDIKMKDMTGFDVLANTRSDNMPIPIFVSAFDDFAIKAFEFEGFDFLLKPYDKKRFDDCLNRVKQFLVIKDYSKSLNRLQNFMSEITFKLDEFRNKPLDKIPVKLGNRTIFIDTNDILIFSASGSYSEIFLENKKLVLRDSLTNLHKSLDKNKFIRVHRSTIINRDFIIEIQTSSYYEIDIIMPKNKKFRVSKSYRNSVLKILGL